MLVEISAKDGVRLAVGVRSSSQQRIAVVGKGMGLLAGVAKM